MVYVPAVSGSASAAAWLAVGREVYGEGFEFRQFPSTAHGVNGPVSGNDYSNHSATTDAQPVNVTANDTSLLMYPVMYDSARAHGSPRPRECWLQSANR